MFYKSLSYNYYGLKRLATASKLRAQVAIDFYVIP